VLLFLSSLPSAAFAQASARESSAQTTARSIGAEALKLYNAQRWEEAHEEFRRADNLFHAPTLVLFMARCQQAQGKLVEAAATYEKILAEPLPNGASKAFVEAHQSAKVELASVRQRTPKVIIELVYVSQSSSGAALSAHITMDSVPVKVGEIAVNPGSHTIKATAKNADPIERSFRIDEASTQRVRLAFKTRPMALAPPGASVQHSHEESSKNSFVPAYAAFAVGASGLAVGSIAWAFSRSQASNEGLNSAATAGFFVGGVGIVAGIVLLAAHPGAEPALVTTANAAHPAKGGKGVEWSATLGLGRVDLRGSF
jgi:tetratricopeptide (TPR) repeat protein